MVRRSFSASQTHKGDRCPWADCRLVTPGSGFPPTVWLSEAPCCPGAGRQHERPWRQHLAAELAKPGYPPRVQTGHVAAGGAHAEGERLPPILEARVLCANRKRALLDL